MLSPLVATVELCRQCEKPFDVTARRQHFCSKQCQLAFQRTRICVKCGVALDKSNWARPGHWHICRTCWNIDCRKRNLSHRQRLKLEVLSHYCHGAPRCQGQDLTCKILQVDDIDILTIDHVKNDGAKHRRQLHRGGVEFYRWLKQQGYPSGYRVLCMNCQLKKEINVRKNASANGSHQTEPGRNPRHEFEGGYAVRRFRFRFSRRGAGTEKVRVTRI